MKKIFPLILSVLVMVVVLWVSRTFWPGQWWATLVLALVAGFIVSLAKRFLNKSFRKAPSKN